MKRVKPTNETPSDAVISPSSADSKPSTAGDGQKIDDISTAQAASATQELSVSGNRPSDGSSVVTATPTTSTSSEDQRIGKRNAELETTVIGVSQSSTVKSEETSKNTSRDQHASVTSSTVTASSSDVNRNDDVIRDPFKSETYFGSGAKEAVDGNLSKTVAEFRPLAATSDNNSSRTNPDRADVAPLSSKLTEETLNYAVARSATATTTSTTTTTKTEYQSLSTQDTVSNDRTPNAATDSSTGAANETFVATNRLLAQGQSSQGHDLLIDLGDVSKERTEERRADDVTATSSPPKFIIMNQSSINDDDSSSSSLSDTMTPKEIPKPEAFALPGVMIVPEIRLQDDWTASATAAAASDVIPPPAVGVKTSEMTSSIFTTTTASFVSREVSSDDKVQKTADSSEKGWRDDFSHDASSSEQSEQERGVPNGVLDSNVGGAGDAGRSSSVGSRLIEF